MWLESAAAHARLRLAAADAEQAVALTEDCMRLIALVRSAANADVAAAADRGTAFRPASPKWCGCSYGV
ncbi:hypothetical protein [Streptomyces sp.]|uniref:hypothetical protein n=1 Tax=Streptomyces sp. TaxID=1931 RepID=UPI0025F93D9D|nr:hypothetical protein [Streptomyces sp.]